MLVLRNDLLDHCLEFQCEPESNIELFGYLFIYLSRVSNTLHYIVTLEREINSLFAGPEYT